MRKAFRAASLLSQQLVGLLATGPLHGDLLKLLFQLPRGPSAPLEAIAGLTDFLDVQFEDVTAPVLALGPLSSFEKGSEPPAAFTQGQRDLFTDLIVIGDRLFGFAGKRNPDGGHMDEN